MGRRCRRYRRWLGGLGLVDVGANIENEAHENTESKYRKAEQEAPAVKVVEHIF